MVGVSAFAGLVVWTPRIGDAAANRMALQVHLRDQLVSFVEDRGIPWILLAPLGEVCAELASALGRGVNAFVLEGMQSCGSPPPDGAVVSNLTVRLLPYELSLVAWAAA